MRDFTRGTKYRYTTNVTWKLGILFQTATDEATAQIYVLGFSSNYFMDLNL